MPVVLPPSTTSSAGHTHLLSHYYGINGDSPSEQDSPTTNLSRQFDGTQSLFEVAARLADGKDLLNDALITITDKNATTKMTNVAIKVIRKSVLPLMDIASTQSRKTANLVGPIAGGNYAHRREEANRKKKIKSSKIIENTGLVMVNEFVNGHSPPDSDRGVQLKRKVASLDDSLPPPDLPANGVEYGVGEFLGIVQTYKRRSKQRGAMIIKMQSPEYNYLKRSRRSVRHCRA
jgi:hypothetical protein